MAGILNSIVNAVTGTSAAGAGNSITNKTQLDLFPAAPTIIPKCFHAGTDWVGQPYVYTDQSSVAMRSKLGQGVMVDNIFGTTISGPVGFFEALENIHVGAGYWTINPTQLESIGSSASVPVPWLVPSTPRLLYSAQTVSNSVSSLKAADPSITAFVGPIQPVGPQLPVPPSNFSNVFGSQS